MSEDDSSIISLTTIPPRFGAIGPTLDSLLAQDLPAPVELWIPETYRRFPDWDGVLPRVPPGVTIRRCAQDWGPATKLVPAALERAGSETDILFCDDDGLYAPDWHRRFKTLRRTRPAEALAALGRQLPPPAAGRCLPRMRRIPQALIRSRLEGEARFAAVVPLVRSSGYADLLGGWCGVMVRPSFFPPELAEGPGRWWPVDDVWFSGLLAAAGTPIWVEASILPPTRRRAGAAADLTRLSVDGLDRAGLDAGCVADLRARFGIWPTR